MSANFKLRDADMNLLDSALLDCYGRFITLLPEEVLRDHIHLPFHLQEAYWWYCDKWQVRHEAALPYLSLSEFLELICTDCPILRKFVTRDDLKDMVKNWRDYAKKIPVRGGIIFNQLCEKVLLVQSYKSKSWSFPRGKIDEAEDDSSCARREILEETGLDVGEHIHEDVYLELVEEDVNLKLFLIPGVDDTATLRQSSSYEISRFRWISLKQLENVKYLKFATFQVKPFVHKVLEFSRDFQAGKFAAQFPRQFRLYQEAVGARARSFRASNNETFGSAARWSPEEMFKVNSEKFGIVSTYNDDDYKNFNVFQSWTPVEIASKAAQSKYKHRDLVPFDPDAFMSSGSKYK